MTEKVYDIRINNVQRLLLMEALINNKANTGDPERREEEHLLSGMFFNAESKKTLNDFTL